MHRIDRYLQKKIEQVLQALSYPHPEFSIEIPKIEAHGDLSINVAMLLASELKQNPRQIAREIVEQLDVDSAVFSKIDIAGPGFINFFFALPYLQKTVADILEQDDRFGKQTIGQDRSAQVEFVSANPTGPLTIGHGRQAVLGDTLANLLEWCGFSVSREYYFNNAGRQMRVLGDSVRLRYRELCGENIDFPEDYYQGEYIIDIARKVKEIHADALMNRSEEDLEIFSETAEKIIFADIKKTLKKLGIQFDIYFNEKELYDSGDIDTVVSLLKEKNLVYEQDGATWFRSTKFNLDQDRVIIKSSGEPTYRLPDIAYHRTKFERGFDLIVDLFGADHIATYPDVLAGVKALGYDPDKIKVLIHQFVTLHEGTEKIKMSTRRANFITLDELMEEVGIDVTRWFFLMRSMDSHLNFDLALAKTQSDENPVYYNQYAHARICSILRNAKEKNVSFKDSGTLPLLEHQAEQQLIKKLLSFPGMVERCAQEYTPHQLTQYLSDVSTAFHKFYTECWVLSQNKDLSQARLALCIATRIVLANGFKILGVSAPETM